MAESIAYFVVNPDKLRSRSLPKYEFIRDRIMQGNIYMSLIREDLTFEVYNLYPDYVFPGKIRRVDIKVIGAPEDDKEVLIEIALHAFDNVLEGAISAYARIHSDAGTYKDVYLYPVGVPRGTPGTVLSGGFKLSKHAKAGYWSPDQVSLTDEHLNERFVGRNDFGWRLYVNNPQEDITPPHYVRNSARLAKSVATREGQEVQLIEASWSVGENSGFMREGSACAAALNDQNLETYSVFEYGDYDPRTETCLVVFEMPDYMPSAMYAMNYIMMTDRALNVSGIYFGDPNHGLRQEESIVDEVAPRIRLSTSNEDTLPPEIDLNRIRIQAEPSRPSDPNGETLVTLDFVVRDDISGVRIASLYLRDPQGNDHHHYVYGNFEGHALFPASDPTQWSHQRWTTILPPGSPPGTWGLLELNVQDRAGNARRYNFAETIHFDIE